MEESRQFVAKEIVWAKVNSYPWWPAKIISILTQPDRKLYKVNFFGDPTYCYLESHFLLNFQCGLARSNCHSPEFKLEKPLQLAKAALAKLNTPLPSPKKAPPTPQLPEQSGWRWEGGRRGKQADEKCLGGKMQKLSRDEGCELKERGSATSERWLEEVREENVVQILSGSSFRCVQLLKGYNNKKQFRFLNQKLKQTLLQKYNLHRIPHYAQQPTPKRKIIRKLKPRANLTSNAIRKIQKILKHKILPSAPRKTALQLVMKLGKYEQDRKGFREGFRSIVNEINTGIEPEQKWEEEKTKLSELMD